ncbi:MAG TPA: hypothetical protein EYG93_04875 [Sulfurospirillum arcachonense]|nr:hypothetical protein [Sulfurospirillum arcachonense]
MKPIVTLILSLILSSTLVAAKNDIKEYDKLFSQIGKKRIGISNSQIDRVKNPFIMTYSKVVAKDGNGTVTIKKPTYTLTAILNNKAKLNGQWYKLHSEIGDFKLVSIRSNSVIIKNEHSKKELFIRKSNVSKIKFSSK